MYAVEPVAHLHSSPSPAISAKFHFLEGLTGNVPPYPTPPHHPKPSPIQPKPNPNQPAAFAASVFLTIFMFQFFIMCSGSLCCCPSGGFEIIYA